MAQGVIKLMRSKRAGARKLLCALLSLSLASTMINLSLFTGTAYASEAEGQAVSGQLDAATQGAQASAEESAEASLKSAEPKVDTIIEGTAASAEAPAEEPSSATGPANGTPAQDDAGAEAPEPDPVVDPMPAQTLSAVASNNAIVVAHAPEGVLPEGTSMIVTGNDDGVMMLVERVIANAGKLVGDHAVYAVSFVDGSGQAVYPAGPVSLSIDGALVQGEQVSVVCVNGGSASIVAELSKSYYGSASASLSMGAPCTYVLVGNRAQDDTGDYFLNYILGDASFADGVTAPRSYSTGDLDLVIPSPVLPGYRFTGWLVEGVHATVVAGGVRHELPAIIDVTGTDALTLGAGTEGSLMLTAQFEEELVTLSYVAGDNGTVSTDSQTLGATVRAQAVTAVANRGYHFVNWTNEAGEEVSTEASFVAPMVDGINVAATYTANFAKDDDALVSYTATEDGSVSLDFEQLDNVTGVASGSTATAQDGYRFANWTDADGTVVSAQPSFVPAMVDGLNVSGEYTANFAPIVDVTLSYVVADECASMGSVMRAFEVVSSVATRVQGSFAIPNMGYRFDRWTVIGNDTNDYASLNIRPAKFAQDTNYGGIYEDTTYVAHFVEADDVTLSYVAGEGGSVSLDSEQVAPATGTPVGCTAVAAKGYRFVGWVNSAGSVVCEDETFVPEKTLVTATQGSAYQPATYTAAFEQDADVTIDYVINIPGAGTLHRYSEKLAPVTGEALGSIAQPAPGYHFESWTDANGTVISTNPAFIPQRVDGVNVAATYTANFVEDRRVTVTYEVDDPVMGSIDRLVETIAPASGTPQGSVATPAPGYKFLYWTCDGRIVSSDASFVPSRAGEHEPSAGLFVEATYRAHFAEADPVAIDYVAGEGGSVSSEGEAVAPVTGSAAGSTASAAPGYHFTGWVDASGAVVCEDETFVPAKATLPDGAGEVYVAGTYTATFAEDDEVTISYTINVAGIGSLSNVVDVIKPVTGVPQGSVAIDSIAGYSFVNWTDSANHVVSTDPAFVPQKDARTNTYVEASYTANFVQDDAVIINYGIEAGDEIMGSVLPRREVLAPATGEARGGMATANPGFHFVCWKGPDGKVVSYDPTFTPQKQAVEGREGTVYLAADYTACFDEDAYVSITYTAATGGSVSLEGESVAPITGTVAGSTAIPAAGYVFANWTDAEGSIVSTDPTFVPAQVDGLNVAGSYTANFTEASMVTINYVASDGGAITGISYETLAPVSGNAVGTRAVAQLGYRFVAWVDEQGNTVGTGETFVPARVDGAYSSATYTAVFQERDPIYVGYFHTVGGTISREVEWVAPVTGVVEGCIPTADPGYHFVDWIDDLGNTYRGDDGVLFVPAKAGGINISHSYTARFEEDADVTISYRAEEGGSTTSAGEQVAPVTGTPAGCVAVPDPGYTFFAWEDANGDIVSLDPEFVPEQTVLDDGVHAVFESNVYTALFIEDYDVTYEYGVSAAQGGTVSRESETLAPATGTALGSVATPAPGYRFVSWTDADGRVVSTSPTLVPSRGAQGTDVAGIYVGGSYTANFAANASTITFVGNNSYPDVVRTGTTDQVIEDTTMPVVSRDRHVFAGWYDNPGLEGEPVTSLDGVFPVGNKTYYAAWHDDYVGTGSNPNASDGIPDMYQVRIDFAAVNGSVDAGYTYVTLYDPVTGLPSATGTGHLSAEQIPAALAAAGYDQDTLTWDITPSTSLTITRAMTLTASFEPEQPTPAPEPEQPEPEQPGPDQPVTPPAPEQPVPPSTTPGPGTGGTGGSTTPSLPPIFEGIASTVTNLTTPAAAAPAAEAIADDATPLAAPDDLAGEETLADDETPLAPFENQQSESNDFLWFIILCALVALGALLFLIVRLRSRKDDPAPAATAATAAKSQAWSVRDSGRYNAEARRREPYDDKSGS